MPKSKNLSEETRWAIITLHKYAGYTNSDIVKKLKCSFHTVEYTISKYLQTNEVKDRERSGRPPTLSENDPSYEIALQELKTHRTLTVEKLSQYLSQEKNIQITKSSLHRLIQKWGFHPVCFRKQPYLTEKHRDKRLRFSEVHLNDDFDNVVFSDEKIFIFSTEGFKVWKKSDEPPICSYTLQNPFKFMVWGGIWLGGRSELCFVDEKTNVDSLEYQNILWKYMIEPEKDKDKYFLQDNAKSHISKPTLDFLDNFEVRLVKDYPPMSPDINAIEKVWGWMVKDIKHKYPKNKEEFKEIIKSSWDSIPQTTIDAYINNTPNVIKEILDSEGGNTK
ncbi:MAG: transposable element Tc1 transposase [Sylvanvirus sp.]|uniref:Transposable element Tc1 transposase n=1 Tax=Sylvanvirus sp. TaxID=2487774 RepID=A0A3G5AHR1_9VIRU|nr:MAG: transposable element Tc1 transposase [Sylvanvirus sp.]